ncbi:MAG: transporter [Flavobacteriales bacterium]|nr:transporter [Flavobacteriia bacterium]NCP04885.1 transporter [Flavobacteriales bacterium]PIV95236.1 MAG: hypothetical protein COW44_00260 [Flavobacteriaceae bacterium CG17_big_fil_post_rev_8_21_14_2_50_33_15]PIY11684.1 MAG: hypothetical protein COZ17_05890 [Flavobacteriaceae bacterium CG_4_10_14_3_um_filter_33_47]PJB16933.1 MAG: hypothetical protein CO117_13370 [Flavobacteriaceae bacterium CG_4_9_14_3_um_filter_33_16]
MKKLFLLIFLFSVGTYAQTCCSGGVPLSNNLGLPNEGKGVFVVGLNYDYNNLNTLNAGTEKLDDNSRQRITNSVLLNFGYAFTDRLSVETLFTWVNQTRTITQFGNENFTETSGIGDAVLLIKYSIPEILGKRTLLNLGVGTKIPFGESDILNDQGIQLTADLQPGSGAWDVLGWFSASKGLNFRPSATLSATATYRFTGVNNSYLNNTATYEFGNEIQTNLGYTDQFLMFNTLFNPGLIFKYRKAFEDKIDDFGIPNTGGEWVFIRPELGAQLTPQINMISRVELPIYSNVVGTQLTPTVRFTIGVTVKLKPKQTNILNIIP